jgi:hypothetical protein
MQFESFLKSLKLIHLSTALVFTILGLDQADAQGAGKYYTGPGNFSGYCPISPCTASNCQVYQYKSGCAFDSPGTCTNCTGIAAGKYFSGSGPGLTDSCVQSACTACPAGKYNVGCSASFAGSCVACSPGNLPVNSYWKEPANATDACPVAPQTVCATGQRNAGYSSTSAGECVACTVVAGYYFTQPTSPTDNCNKVQFTVPPAGQKLVGANSTFPGVVVTCPALANGSYYINASGDPCAAEATASCTDSDCVVGQYKKGCSGGSSGACAPCTGANASQVYITKGSWSNTCQVAGCEKVCPSGQYVVGCGLDGMSSSSLTCGSCTNAVANINYYVGQGGYTPTSCPVSACRVCANGNYLLGCGGTVSGTCTTCTNLVY